MKIDKIHILLLAIIVVIGMLLYYSVYNKDKKMDELTAKIELLEKERDANNIIIDSLQSKIDNLNIEVDKRTDKIAEVEGEIERVRREIRKKDYEIDKKSREIDMIRKRLNIDFEPKEPDSLIESLKNNIQTLW